MYPPAGTMTEPAEGKPVSGPTVLVEEGPGWVMITLNRPGALNSLNLDMVRSLQAALKNAAASGAVRLVLLRGAGARGFCAGGDIKSMARAVREGDLEGALQFLREEYALDLFIHRFPRPVVVLAHGITMGGGLGLAAGADVVAASETTLMAMPETRIGFFPDVGATGWLFAKCPPGYAEFLGLTGYEMKGAECVRLGLASDLIPGRQLEAITALLKAQALSLPRERRRAGKQIRALLAPFISKAIPSNPDMDQWVQEYFQGKASILGLLEELRACSIQDTLCEGVFTRLSERSPTAVCLTLALLRGNENRSLESVFETDLRAAAFLLGHPDFTEGVRARVLDKDDHPVWRPARFEELSPRDLPSL